jgi:hypothetical protein
MFDALDGHRCIAAQMESNLQTMVGARMTIQVDEGRG